MCGGGFPSSMCLLRGDLLADIRDGRVPSASVAIQSDIELIVSLF